MLSTEEIRFDDFHNRVKRHELSRSDEISYQITFRGAAFGELTEARSRGDVNKAKLVGQ